MPTDLLRTLLEMLEVFRPCLTSRGFDNFLVLFTGWVLTAGPHAVTQALVVTGVAGCRHHEAFHRFFSRGTWQPDELGRRLLLRLLARMAPAAPLCVVVDDTLAAKKGPHVFGIGSHLDAVRSTKRQKVFCFGHCWVVLAVLVPVPFSRRTWALPLLFRLYRNQKDCERKGQPHRKKTELAREMLDLIVGWTGPRRIELAADSAYCNDTVMRGLPPHVVLFGSMRPDAVLTSLPSRRRVAGRPRVRGAVLPKPQALADNPRIPWLACTAHLYGRRRRIQYKVCDAQWYRACGSRLLRIVIVRQTEGAMPLRVFFCTDPTLAVARILEGYACRWGIEVCFRDLKQQLGFADSSARKKQAVERVAPFVGLTYSTLVLWFDSCAWRTPLAAPPVRPWYARKRGASFADVLRTAQRVLVHAEVLDLRSGYGNLQKPAAVSARPPLMRPRARRWAA